MPKKQQVTGPPLSRLDLRPFYLKWFWSTRSKAERVSKMADSTDDPQFRGTVREESIANGQFVEKSLPLYRLCPLTKLMQTKKKKLLYAHKLGNRRFVRPQLYVSPSQGGIFHPGEFRSALALLQRIPGYFDELKLRFTQMALSANVSDVFLEKLRKAESEGSVKHAIELAINNTCIYANSSTPSMSEKRYYGARGIVCKLTGDKKDIESRAGFAGNGDLGILSAMTGEFVVAIELKKDAVNGGWLDSKRAQLLYNQGFSFMVGKDCDILLLANRTNYLLMWRTPTALKDGKTVYRYFMYPDREYAAFTDPTHLMNFLEIIGELARISAYKIGSADAAAEQILTQVKSRRTSPDEPSPGISASPTTGFNESFLSVSDGSKSNGCCIEGCDAASCTTESLNDFPIHQACKERLSFAESSLGLVDVGCFDVAFHATEDQLKAVIDYCKPPIDPE